ncbi:MAG: hypothetical protein RI894_2668 [Bacteroidota bacterium]|jgi:RsiW-degrading membrane proteinase PrsW (M82 family)
MNYYLFAIAVLPGILVCFAMYRLDRYDREPLLVIIASFLLGIFSCLPAYFIETVGKKIDSGFLSPIFIKTTMLNSLLQTAIFAFLIVALTEEGCKYLFLRFYCYNHKAFNEPLDGIIYSVAVSMGFATWENVIYGLQNDSETLLLRMVTAIPAHAAFAIIMGYHLGLSKFESQPIDRRLAGLTAAILAHGCYDFLLFQTVSPIARLLAFVVLGICIFYAWGLLRSLLIDSEKRWRI